MFRISRVGVVMLAVLTAGGSPRAQEFRVGSCGPMEANAGGVQIDGKQGKELDRLITDFLSGAGLTPAVSVAIVRSSQIIYARGFGYRNLAGCAKAGIDTRYYLKSTTKSFLGLGVALLHEEGRIALDQPITEYLPDLAMPEGINVEQVTLRSHFTHTQPYFDSGLNYRTAFPGNLPDTDLIDHVNRYGQPKDITFRYSNFGPIVGAHAVYTKTGEHWRDLIADRVFAPAGMTQSFTSMAKAEQGPMATAYVRDGTEFVSTLTKTDSMMHAAGGAVSTVADLARWVILNLDEGRIDGAQVFPRRAVEHAHARQVYLDLEFSEFHRFAHGLGIYSADYEGDLLMHHFGGETHVSFMPQHDLGIVVLSNAIADGVMVTHPLAATLYDHLLGKTDVAPRMARRLNAIAERRTQLDKRLRGYLAQVVENAPEGPPARTPSMVAGDYWSDRLGKMSVHREGVAGVTVTFGSLSAPMKHLGGDRYLVDLDPWQSMPPQLFEFRQQEDGAEVLDWGGRIFVRSVPIE